MTYRNERAMNFEKSVAKFVKEVDDLEKYERGMHNADVVDLIWKKMTNPDPQGPVPTRTKRVQGYPPGYCQSGAEPPSRHL